MVRVYHIGCKKCDGTGRDEYRTCDGNQELKCRECGGAGEHDVVMKSEYDREISRLQSEIKDLLNKLGLPETYPTCQFDPVDCHPDICEFEDCEYQGKSKYDEVMELLEKIVINRKSDLYQSDDYGLYTCWHCDKDYHIGISGRVKEYMRANNSREYTVNYPSIPNDKRCTNPDCPAVQAREKVKEWRASNGSI